MRVATRSARKPACAYEAGGGLAGRVLEDASAAMGGKRLVRRARVEKALHRLGNSTLVCHLEQKRCLNDDFLCRKVTRPVFPIDFVPIDDVQPPARLICRHMRDTRTYPAIARTSIHEQRTAERAGNARHGLEPRKPTTIRALDEVRKGNARANRHVHLLGGGKFQDLPLVETAEINVSELFGENDHRTIVPPVADEQVAPLANDAPRDVLFGENVEREGEVGNRGTLDEEGGGAADTITRVARHRLIAPD